MESARPRRQRKYCRSSSNAEQNREADSKLPKPRIGSWEGKTRSRRCDEAVLSIQIAGGRGFLVAQVLPTAALRFEVWQFLARTSGEIGVEP